MEHFKQSIYEVLNIDDDEIVSKWFSNEDNFEQSKKSYLTFRVEIIKKLIDEVVSYLRSLYQEAIDKTDQEIANIRERIRYQRSLLDPDDKELQYSDEDEDTWEEISNSDDFEFYHGDFWVTSYLDRIRYAYECYHEVLVWNSENPTMLHYLKVHSNDDFESFSNV